MTVMTSFSLTASRRARRWRLHLRDVMGKNCLRNRKKKATRKGSTCYLPSWQCFGSLDSSSSFYLWKQLWDGSSCPLPPHLAPREYWLFPTTKKMLCAVECFQHTPLLRQQFASGLGILWRSLHCGHAVVPSTLQKMHWTVGWQCTLHFL